MTILVDGELILYGFVGENFWDEGFTAQEVVAALAEHGRDNPITVRINSGGGYVDDGVAIFNALSTHKGKVTVVVDGNAASSASVIAMAGKDRIMRKGAMLMIHDPASVVWGTAEDMGKAVTMLEKHAVSLAGIYADVTGEDFEDIRADMKAETWLTAEEAVERGFATSANDNKAKPAAAHDYSIYAHAPSRLVALSARKNWSHKGPGEKALASAGAGKRHEKETLNMTEQAKADDHAAEIAKASAAAAEKAANDATARIKAIMTAEDAVGRETLANHFAYETTMTAEAAIAALKAAPKAAADKQGDNPTGAYEQQRLAAGGLAAPGGKPESAAKPDLRPQSIYDARRAAIHQ